MKLNMGLVCTETMITRRSPKLALTVHFAGVPGFRILPEQRVQNRIRNAITPLVRMSFRCSKAFDLLFWVEKDPHGRIACGPALAFKNGYVIAGTRCYMDGSPYSEPEMTNALVYRDDSCQVRKLWHWNANSIYEDEETGLLKVLLRGWAFNGYGESVFATIDGKRLTTVCRSVGSAHARAQLLPEDGG